MEGCFSVMPEKDLFFSRHFQDHTSAQVWEDIKYEYDGVLFLKYGVLVTSYF